jgi:hypothetical protein
LKTLPKKTVEAFGKGTKKGTKAVNDLGKRIKKDPPKKEE